MPLLPSKAEFPRHNPLPTTSILFSVGNSHSPLFLFPVCGKNDPFHRICRRIQSGTARRASSSFSGCFPPAWARSDAPRLPRRRSGWPLPSPDGRHAAPPPPKRGETDATSCTLPPETEPSTMTPSFIRPLTSSTIRRRSSMSGAPTLAVKTGTPSTSSTWSINWTASRWLSLSRRDSISRVKLLHPGLELLPLGPSRRSDSP